MVVTIIAVAVASLTLGFEIGQLVTMLRIRELDKIEEEEIKKYGRD